jgi:hypothetical protein
MLKTYSNSLIVIIVALVYFVTGVKADNTGYLSVSVEKGMQVFIDTTFVAENSFSYMELPVGDYKVHVYNAQTHDWADRGMTKFITINENEYVKLDFVLTDQIKILSLPVGGKVFAGEELIGNTPLIFDRSLVGGETIKIEKNGYKNQSFKLENSQREYSFSLRPIENDPQIQVARVSENQGGLKWYREGLVVTSLIASWTSFYYKRQADQSYARYQVTSDSRKRFSLYSQTRQYDTFAEIAIGVSVATLGTYFFLLLIN